MTTATTPAQEGVRLQPLLLSAARVAELCGISVRLVWQLSACNKMPGPVAIGSRKLWRYADVAAWVEAGCKPMTEDSGK